ncbi:MAG: MgtC/SapB family protein [bacterium JZ-2024 1]
MIEEPLGILQMVTRLIVAVIFGTVIGYERKRSGKAAGPRTHAIVALGSALFGVIGTYLSTLQGVDASRIPSQVVVGIGFLGAGAIISSGGVIKGLTTAATIWIASAVGLATGLGFFAPALISVILGLIILVILPRLERLVTHPAHISHMLVVQAKDTPEILERILGVLAPQTYQMEEVEFVRLGAGIVEYVLDFTAAPDIRLPALVEALESIPEVRAVKVVR